MPIPLYFTAVGVASQRAQTTTPVSSNNNYNTVASSGSSSLGQHVVGAAPVALGQTLAGAVVGSVAQLSQPGVAQVPRPALAPSHAIQPSLLSQRLVLASQAQARLPSKWPPPLPHQRLPSTSGTTERAAETRPFPGTLLICVVVLALKKKTVLYFHKLLIGLQLDE